VLFKNYWDKQETVVGNVDVGIFNKLAITLCNLDVYVLAFIFSHPKHWNTFSILTDVSKNLKVKRWRWRKDSKQTRWKKNFTKLFVFLSMSAQRKNCNGRINPWSRPNCPTTSITNHAGCMHIAMYASQALIMKCVAFDWACKNWLNAHQEPAKQVGYTTTDCHSTLLKKFDLLLRLHVCLVYQHNQNDDAMITYAASVQGNTLSLLDWMYKYT